MQNHQNQPQQNINVEKNNNQHLGSGKSENLKRIFFQILIGCLVGSAFIAVVAVLTGAFNKVLGRSLLTIFLVAVHTILSFGYLNETDKQNKKNRNSTTELFTNTVFTLIAISFVTSIFASWGLIGGQITSKLYLCYGVVLFATLHADLLYKLRNYQRTIDNLIVSNYFVMSVVVFMLFMVILVSDSNALGEYFYRFLAAIGIIDATLTLTISIMHRLFLQKHPELAERAENSRVGRRSFLRNPLVVIVLLYVIAQSVGAIIRSIAGM